MARESISPMELAPKAVDVAAEERTSRWRSDNPLARALARIPLPIRAKQLFGTFAVAALLALVAVLGLVALGQSNSRGTELRRLQQRGVYEQLLLTDATQLKQLIDYWLGPGSNERPTPPDESDLPHYDPDSYQRGYLSAWEQQIGTEFGRLCLDAGAGAEMSQCLQGPNPTLPHLPLTLRSVAPSLYEQFEGSGLGPIHNTVSLFFQFSGASGTPQGPVRPLAIRSDRWAGSFAEKLAVLTRKTQARATALVATNRSSYNRSRDLLIGAGAGSLLLALAIALLLSDSFVVPLQKTQRRLAAIAAGNFSGHLEVSNRDEIGALAADVNRMSDELQRAYRELELASERKSEYVTNMSHELRTPLNAIIGFSEVLHEQMFGELNERQLGYVEDVLAAGRHLLSLINDLLDLAKIEAGSMELELAPVAVPAVLQSAIALHTERADRGGITLSVTSEPDEITVSADERRLRQVVFNLLSNAVKFTPAGGRVDISALVDDGHVEIAVADTGPGIPAGDLESIFEEFEQTSDGKKVEGTGLGLPLSRKLVELHGGRLWVDSVVGRGSTFRFTLPAGAARQPDGLRL